MPIPLTPPDDEVGIGMTDSSIILKGLLIFIVAQPAFVFNSTMSSYDYVYLITKAMSSMTMLYPTFTYPFSVYPLFLFSSNITFYLIFYNQ